MLEAAGIILNPQLELMNVSFGEFILASFTWFSMFIHLNLLLLTDLLAEKQNFERVANMDCR